MADRDPQILKRVLFGTYMDNLLLRISYADGSIKERFYDYTEIQKEFGLCYTAFQLAVYFALDFGALSQAPYQTATMGRKARFIATATTAI